MPITGIRRLSGLHAKGLTTLGLLLLADSMSVSNAASAWKLGQKQTGGSFPGECPLSSDGTCSTASPSSIPRNSLARKAKRTINGAVSRSTQECCSECSECMDPETIKMASRLCPSVPRGGHSHHSHDGLVDGAAAAAAGAVPFDLPLNAWKVIFQAFLTALNVFCWLIPLRSKKISENKLALSLANAFSGGVFLSLAFGHLIPECVHGFADAPGLPETAPYLLVLAGYLLIFFVEKVAFDAHDIMHEMEHAGEHTHTHNHKHNGHASADTGKFVGGRSAVILLGALAVHSILEMMALGLSDSFGDCALLTLSISLHQPAESIALLVAFLKSGMPKDDIVKFLSVFSCMGPIGVGLGMAVNEFAAPIVDAIMLAIVAGTFVYVGATEVIPEEWEDSSNKWSKFAALLSGIVSILVITQYTMSLEGAHSH